MVSARDKKSQEADAMETMVKPNTAVVYEGQRLGRGTLRIAPHLLSWTDETKQLGFSMRYPDITVHAIKNEPVPSIYMMVDCRVEIPRALLPAAPAASNLSNALDEGSSDEESYPDDEEGGMIELIFEPEDPLSVNQIYDILSDLQAMHPDPEDSFDEEDEEIYQDASDVVEANGTDQKVSSPGDSQVEAQPEQPDAAMDGADAQNNPAPQDGDDMECDPELFADAKS